MKKVLFLLLGLFVSLSIFAQLGYRCEGKFIQLIPSNTQRYYVYTRNTESKEYLERVIKTELLLKNAKNNVYKISEVSFFVSSKSNLLDNDYISELFHDLNGNPYYILPRIILATKDHAHINDIVKKYEGILSIDSIQRLKGMVTISCNLTSAQDVLRVVAELDSYDEVEWCEPDMIFKWEPHDSNPLFSMQYYLQNGNSGQYDINVVPAWEITTGSENVTVAVIDEGVDLDHEDLSGNVLQGYTIGDSTGYGRPKNANEFGHKGHGVACAGIIGGKNNDKGILGVAHGIKLLPINIVPNVPEGYYENGRKYVTDNGFAKSGSDIAYAIQWAAERADVLSCSWGSNSECSLIKNAMNNAMTYGRNGKGCIVVASSGNDYPYIDTIKFPARMDSVIAVGAIDKYGSIQSYSQRGSALNLVAPSGDGNSTSDIVTTDRMGTLGYNPAETYGYDLANTNYTQRFGGTSAACPQVAGVVALMLSVRPDLTEAEVRTALQQTARDLGATGFDTTYGYGLVDAYAAVSSVVPHSILGDDYVYGHEVYSVGNLGDYLSVSWSLSGDNASNFTLQNDTPSLNQCRITRVEGAGFSGSTSLTLTAHVIYNGTTIKTLTKQLVAPYISGPHIPCGFTTYIVESRPANSTVEWSSSGVNMGYDTDPSGLMPDDPTAYVIINNDYETIHGTLTATVKVNGNVVGTLTKQVDTGGEFSATWYQGNNSTPATLPNHAIIELTGGGHIYMQSNDFIGANVTHSSSGIMVQNWSHVGNTISFSPLIPAFWGGIIRIEGVVPNNCKKFDVRFTKIDPIPPFLLSISQSGQTCLFSLDVEQNNEDGEREAVDIPANWQLAISEGETGKVVYEARVSSREISINTDGWRAGVYIGTALVEGRHVTCKFVVTK